MSEKRFEAMESGFISDKRDKSLLNLYDCRDLLNNLHEENEQLRTHYQNLVDAIVKTCNDLGKEDIYLGDFDICKRITEYEKELLDDE